jgi:hypothetical protein
MIEFDTINCQVQMKQDESPGFYAYCIERATQVKYNIGDNRNTVWMKCETPGVRG